MGVMSTPRPVEVVDPVRRTGIDNRVRPDQPQMAMPDVNLPYRGPRMTGTSTIQRGHWLHRRTKLKGGTARLVTAVPIVSRLCNRQKRLRWHDQCRRGRGSPQRPDY